MRKIFTLLVLCLLASVAWAEDITFVAGVDNGNSDGTAKPFVIEKSGITIAVSNGLANDTQYRVYKSQTMTITSAIGDIIKIEVHCTANGEAQYGPGCFTTAPEAYTFEPSGKIGTWNGSATKVVFTAATNQVRMTQIIVTVGKASLAAPAFEPAAGTYYDPIKVKITCPTQGAKIYYTTNGSTPTTSSTQYTGEFTLSSNTTVKAISAKDGEVSDVVEAVYEFGTAKEVANLAEYARQADGTVVKFKNPVNTVAQQGRYLYVADNSGYGLFYGATNQTYATGDVIPAGFVGTKTTYSSEPELTELTSFNEASGHVELVAEDITTANVDHAHWAHYVHFAKATIDPEAKTLTDATGTAPVYFSMGITASQVVAGTEYEVWAVIGSYQPKEGDLVYQILPIKVKRIGAGGVGIGTMGDYADNEMLTFEYDATVLYHANQRLFVKDETGFGLIYGNVGQTYKQGDVIPAGYGGKKTTYGGEPELASPFSGFEAASRTVTVNAETVTADGIDHEHFAHYVVLKNVTISEVSGNNFKITDANDKTCNGYNQFGQDIQEGFYAELYGIVGSYGKDPVYQLLPIVKSVPVPVKNINELYALNSGRQGHFSTALTAIYQNGANLYVQDVDGTQSLVYGSVPGTFTNGDLINDAIASWTLYQNVKQMVPVENFVPAGRGNIVEPDDPMPIEEVSQDMVHRYLSFEDIMIVAPAEEGGNYLLQDETGSMILFDKFGVMPENLNLDVTHYVEGFLTVYKGELEFYPILIDGGDCGIKGDVNNDHEINLADVNALIDIILGANADDCTRWRADVAEDSEIGVADVNALIDMILSANN